MPVGQSRRLRRPPVSGRVWVHTTRPCAVRTVSVVGTASGPTWYEPAAAPGHKLSGFGAVAPAVSNSGTVRASGGTLALAGGALGATGTVLIDTAATLSLGAVSSARNLTHNGTLLALGSNNVSVFNDYDNAGFGVGNSFNRRAGVFGTGQILASGTTQQTLSGALISGGATGNATLTLPTLRVGLGAISSTFTINNIGVGGPNLRGALLTTGINNAGLSGSGVTAQNWGAVAQSGPGQTFSVSFNPSFGQALSGQVLQVVNNFDNVAGQSLTFIGQAFNLASASAATPSPVVLANQRVGGTLSQALTLTNTALNSGFSEGLNATIVASGTATAGGAFNLLAAGASSNALFVGVNTSTAGAKSGTASIALASDGTAAGNSGFSALGIAGQQVQVSGNVFRVAAASTVSPAGPITLGNQRVGGALSQSLSFSNVAANDGFSERLSASVSAGGTATASGSFSLLQAGSSSGAITVGVNTATAGAKTGVVSIALASDGSGTSGFTALALATQTVTVSGAVFAPALAQVNVTPIVLAARVGGAAPLANVTVQNNAVGAFAETLSANWASPVPAGFALSGAASGLGSGQSSSNLTVALQTGTAGSFQGNALIDRVSTVPGPTTTTPLALGQSQVSVTGRVWAPAVPVLASAAVNFGIVRVGDVATRSLTVSNNNTGGLTDNLSASLSAVGAAPFTASGNVTGLASGQSNNSALVVNLSTQTAGVFQGNGGVGFSSNNTDLAALLLSSAPVTFAGQVNNVAGSALTKQAGTGVLSGGGLVAPQLRQYVFNFGSITEGTGALGTTLQLGNVAQAPGDTLSGVWDLSTLGIGGFTLAGFSGFSLAPQVGSGPLSVSLSDSTVGLFDRTVSFTSRSVNGFGADLTLATVELRLIGNVAAIPEPGTYVLMLGGGLMLLAWTRRRQRSAV